MLIAVNTESIVGAYVRFREEAAPTLLYAHRLPIETRGGEPREKAMLRTLAALANELVREGAPILLRASGSGRAETILVSIDTPWQETRVRTENFERNQPFTFTQSMVAMALEKTRASAPEKTLVDESIIGTILNGYETRDPYGKKTRRASVIVLSSLIDEKIAGGINATLRGIFHTKNILSIVGSSLRYQAMRAAFSHERDALILDASGPLISISLVRKGLFTALAEVANDPDSRRWVNTVTSELASIAEKYPLPRIIFLLAHDAHTSSLRQALAKGDLGKLWLSENPPKIVPVLASHLSGLVRHTTTTPPDLQLLLMALYFSHFSSEQ